MRKRREITRYSFCKSQSLDAESCNLGKGKGRSRKRHLVNVRNLPEKKEVERSKWDRESGGGGWNGGG